MSSRLMNLPAELRLEIYEWVFCDSAPDENVILDTKTTAEKDPLAARIAAPINNAAPEQPSNNQALRQINLWSAKDHYPFPTLLAACAQIHFEAKPVFDAFVKKFRNMDLLNISIDMGRAPRPKTSFESFPDSYLRIGREIKNRTCVNINGVKAVRLLCLSESLTIRVDESGELSVSSGRDGAGIIPLPLNYSYPAASGRMDMHVYIARRVFENCARFFQDRRNRDKELRTSDVLDHCFSMSSF